MLIKNDFEYFDDWVMFTYRYVKETGDKICLVDKYPNWEFVSQSGSKFFMRAGCGHKSYYAGKLKFGPYMLTQERKQRLVEIINRQFLVFI